MAKTTVSVYGTYGMVLDPRVQELINARAMAGRAIHRTELDRLSQSGLELDLALLAAIGAGVTVKGLTDSDIAVLAQYRP